jgi:hypothetical protein
MNDKILLLAEQATTYIEPTSTSGEGWIFSKEKFAQLIVRECARVADVADENKCEWIGGNILTHFGVEE